MKCPKCGKEIAYDSKFCEFCGAKIKNSIFRKFCYKCWHFSNSKQHCDNCGAELNKLSISPYWLSILIMLICCFICYSSTIIILIGGASMIITKLIIGVKSKN